MWRYAFSTIILFLLTNTVKSQSEVTLFLDKDTTIFRDDPNSNFGNGETLVVSENSRVLLNFDIDDFDLEVDVASATLQFKTHVSDTSGGELIVAPLVESFKEGDGGGPDGLESNDLFGSTWNCWIEDEDLSNNRPDCDSSQEDFPGGEYDESRAITVSFDNTSRMISVDVTDHVIDGVEEWILMFPDRQSGSIEIQSEEVEPYEGAVMILGIYDMTYIFDDKEVRDWNIIIEQEDMDFLLADPRAEEYVPCSIEFEGRTVWDGIGCRFKGDASNLKHCMDDVPLPIPDPWTTHNCRTLHWQMDSNTFRDDKQRFHGLKKLQFHGFNENMQYISEHLAYEIWEEVGVASARTAYVTLHINGEFSHLMMIVEEIDDIFAKDRFSYDANEGEGSLYKEPWPNALEGWYYDEWWREDGPKNGDFWVELASWADENEAVPSNEEEARDLIEPWFDMDPVDKHQAIVTLLNHGSTVNAVLCIPCRSPLRDPENVTVSSVTGDTRYRHNYFFYLEETEEFGDRLILVPWDFDSTMSDSRISILESDHWTIMPQEEDGDCDLSESGSRFQSPCDPMGYLWSLGTRGQLVENYRHYGSIYSPEWFVRRVNELKDFLRPYVIRDMLTPSVDEWEDFVDYWLEAYLGPNLDGRSGTRAVIDDYVFNDIAGRIEEWNEDGGRRRTPESSSPENDLSSSNSSSCIELSGQPRGSPLQKIDGVQSSEECCDECLSEFHSCEAWGYHRGRRTCYLLRSVDTIECSSVWKYNLMSRYENCS